MGTPTGEQFELVRASATRQSRAIITEVAAGLRALSVDGIDLVETYPEASLPPWGSGIVLAPWPNRVRDGKWMLDGREQLLDLTEPDKFNAIHGLLRNTAYRMTARTESSITMSATIFPQHGYKFQVDTGVTYQLTDDGIEVTHTVTNAGTNAAPVAIGAHPYLRIGDVPTEDLTLTVAASTRYEVDDRLNPTGEHDVDGTPFDLRAGVRVGDLSLDDGFGGVPADGVHRVAAPDGQVVELWRDAEFAFVQVFTNRLWPRGDGAGGDGLGLAVAVEPMTAPANALNSGAGLRWLEPGETWELHWGIRYSSGTTAV